MNFKQFLKEDQGSLFEYLKTNCTQSLAESGSANNVMMRGSKADEVSYRLAVRDGRGKVTAELRNVRKDRRPRDTPGWASQVIDDWFEEAFNVRARSQCLFVYGGDGLAGGYGRTSAIFPLGKYRIIWSPKITDLTDHLFPSHDYDGSPGTGRGNNNWDHHPTREEEIQMIQDMLDDAGYTDANNEDAIKSNKELMIDCKQYLRVGIPQYLRDENDSYAPEFKFTQSDLIREL